MENLIDVVAPRQLLGATISAGVTALVGSILALVGGILGGTAMIIAATFLLVAGTLLFPAGLLAGIAKVIAGSGLPLARLMPINGTISVNGNVLTLQGDNLTVRPIDSVF